MKPSAERITRSGSDRRYAREGIAVLYSGISSNGESPPPTSRKRRTPLPVTPPPPAAVDVGSWLRSRSSLWRGEEERRLGDLFGVGGAASGMVGTIAANPSPIASVPGVVVGPGETALTRTPFGPYSAPTLVSSATAAFEAP